MGIRTWFRIYDDVLLQVRCGLFPSPSAQETPLIHLHLWLAALACAPPVRHAPGRPLRRRGGQDIYCDRTHQVRGVLA